MRPHLLQEVREFAAQRGLNLFGLVDARRYDSSQPCDARVGSMLGNCGTIVVLATAGKAAAGMATRSSSFEVAALLQSQAIALRMVEIGIGARLRLGCLAEAAGFGTVSPVSGLLVHPVYGPWLRLRAALLLEGHPFGPIAEASISERFQPCVPCARPCVPACPAAASDGAGHHDLAACADHRHGGGCGSGCGVRVACPIGAEHRDAALGGVTGHVVPLAALRRWFGLGVWRFVPGALRPGR
jgi:hypothetical protein